MVLLHTLYDTVPGSPISLLLEDYVVGSTPEILLINASIAPDAPNIITVMSADKTRFATVHYATKIDYALTDLTVIRGVGLTFEAMKDFCVRNYTYEDDTAVKGNLTDHEARIEVLEQGIGHVAWGNITGEMADQTDLTTEFDGKADLSPGSPDIAIGNDGGGLFVMIDDENGA